jgi:glycosyltransferase involved in cell wall biosynthesis
VPEDHYVFLFLFDMYSEFERKNPLTVIRAFREAFRLNEKASLVIKVSRGHADPVALLKLQAAADAAGVTTVNRVVSRAQAFGFIAMCDCFVSLHRSEGFGLPLAEAMLLGKPAIATGYSGNLAFMNAENSYLVGYKLTQIQRSGPIYREGNFWAEPLEAEATQWMRHVFDHRDEAANRAKRARDELKDKLSFEKFGRRMLARLNEINLRR